MRLSACAVCKPCNAGPESISPAICGTAPGASNSRLIWPLFSVIASPSRLAVGARLVPYVESRISPAPAMRAPAPMVITGTVEDAMPRRVRLAVGSLDTRSSSPSPLPATAASPSTSAVSVP